MLTLETLTENIEFAINDPDMSSELIKSKINQAIAHISSVVLLPALESQGSIITTSGSSQITPSIWDFDRNAFYAESNVALKIANSVETMASLFPNYETEQRTGPVQCVLVTKSTITYYPIPDTPTEIFIKFYKNPTMLSEAVDVDTSLPLNLAQKLIETFVLAELSRIIEKGVEGRKIDTVDYVKQFNLIMLDLVAFLVSKQSNPKILRFIGWV